MLCSPKKKEFKKTLEHVINDKRGSTKKRTTIAETALQKTWIKKEVETN
jgi:hypothetical protein